SRRSRRSWRRRTRPSTRSRRSNPTPPLAVSRRPREAASGVVGVVVDKRKILIQLDSDPLPSVFDRVVAVDAGADEIFSYGGVRPEQVRDLIHGAIFTRHPDDLKSTAVFIGGSDVTAGEQLLHEARRHMLP